MLAALREDKVQFPAPVSVGSQMCVSLDPGDGDPFVLPSSSTCTYVPYIHINTGTHIEKNKIKILEEMWQLGILCAGGIEVVFVFS